MPCRKKSCKIVFLDPINILNSSSLSTGHTVSDPLSYYIVFCCRLRMSDVEVIPPEGKTSFSGIPESQFIDDVALYMKVMNPAWLRLPYASAVLWIRIHWGRFRIQHFRLNTQQDSDPGFSWPKIVKKLQVTKIWWCIPYIAVYPRPP